MAVRFIVDVVSQFATASVSVYPTRDILPGEVAIYTITGVTGYAGNIRDLDFEWDWDDTGASLNVAQNLPAYATATGNFGRVVAKAWATTGTKAPTLTIRDRTGILNTQTLSKTVVDPSTIAWDNDLYVDFGEVSGTPDFTGAPAVGGAVQHISSMAALEAVDMSNPAENNRVTFKRGETFSWGSSSVVIKGRSFITSVATFGSGAHPTLQPGVAVATIPFALFNPGTEGNQSEFAAYQIKIDGGYSSVDGAHTPDRAKINICQTGDANSGNLYRSLCEVDGQGMRGLINSSGTYRFTDGNEKTYLGVYDCRSMSYSNYGLSQWGSQCTVAVHAFQAEVDPNTLLRDDKDATRTEATDHNPMRITVCEYLGVTGCALIGSGGWTQAGPTFAMQPCLRILPVYSDTDLDGSNPPFTKTAYGTTVINIQGNHGAAPSFLNIGRNKDGDKGYFPRFEAIVERNEWTSRRQTSGAFITCSTTGITARNNVVYFPNVSEASGTQRTRFIQVVQPIEADWTFEPGWSSDQIVISGNTIVSDRNFADHTLTDVNGSWAQAAPITEGNVVWAPSQPTPVTTWGALDRSDNFRAITGSSAIDASAGDSYTPVRDFDGAIRRATTNHGAHDDSNASAGTVAAPVNTAIPTIAALSAYPNEYHATSLGTWTGLDLLDTYQQEYEWRIGGVPMQYAGLQSPWNAGRLYWIADTDGGTPTATQVRQGQNSTGASAQASGNIESVTGFNSGSGTIDPGLTGSYTMWFAWRAVATGDETGPESLSSTSTASITPLTGSTGSWGVTGNGDGTVDWTHTPLSGNLTLQVTYTNRSGQRASAESAAVVLP